jgi:hypothetical protein
VRLAEIPPGNWTVFAVVEGEDGGAILRGSLPVPSFNLSTINITAYVGV